MGRKRKFDKEKCEYIIASDKSAKELAAELNVSVPLIYNVVRQRPPYNFTNSTGQNPVENHVVTTSP